MDVSVIIPTYNRLWCLPKAINSCRNTHCSTEIIVVDDGSTDGTWEWLQTQKDIKSVFQPNQGQTYAINKGISLASGKYLRFLDSDDFLCEGTIDKQFEAAEKTGASLVYGRVDNYAYETEKITQCPTILHPWTDFLEVQLGNGYGSHFLGMLFHRELIEKVPRRPDYANREDRMFLLEIGLLEPITTFTDGCMGYWVTHNTQMQANYSGLKASATNWQHLNIYKKIIGTLIAQNKLSIGRKHAVATSLWPLAHWIAKTHLKDAIDVVKWIYELNPDFQIPERGYLGLLYKNLGFANTEKILRLRRIFRYGLFTNS